MARIPDRVLLIVRGLALLLAVTALFGGRPSVAQSVDDIDSPDFWAEDRRQIAQLGEGFLVWEAHRNERWSIWTIKLDGSGLRQLTPMEYNRDQFCPHISPDGKTVAYLSCPRGSGPHEEASGKAATPSANDQRSPLHLINADGSGDRIIVSDAHKYGAGWDRAVTWFTPTRLAYIGPDDNAYELDLSTGKSVLLVSGGGGWLPNTTMTHVATSFNTFSLLDAKTKTVTPMPHLGGCQPYFTHDGQWGFWMAGMGGPIGKMRLSTREWSVLLDSEILPKQRNYCYFPNVSSSQCLLAFAAANHDKLRGGYGGYILSDYNVFLVQIDPNTLDILGKPVRYSFDAVCNRFPDVYQPPPALGFRSNKAPFQVDFASPGPGQWAWDFGDGVTANGPSARHLYAEPGLYVVSAQGAKAVHGRVRVLPAKAPKALGAVLEGDRTLVVSFDEPVNFKGVSLRLASGGSIEKWVPSPDARSLRATLANKPSQADAILVENALDLAQKPNKMEPARLAFEPRFWPTNPEGLVFVWQAANKRNQIIDPTSGKPTAYRFHANDNARLDENYALRPDGGSFRAVDFGPQFGDAVRKSNAFSLEMTLTPEPANHQRVRAVCSYNLFQRGDKLYYRELPDMELCTLTPGEPAHILITYTPGNFVCYLNGSQVFITEKITGDLRGVRGDPLVVGNNLDNQPWLGTVEGIAIFGRALSAEEARAEAEAAGRLRQNRKPLATVEIEAKLTATSRPPTLARIAPYRQGLMTNEYTVTKVRRGKLDARKIRVAHWVILDKQTLDLAQLPVGHPVRLVVAPLTANRQLSGENITDTLLEDFDVPMFYAVSARWDHHVIPRWSVIGSFIAKPQDPNIEQGKMDPDPRYSEVFGPETRTGLPTSYTPGPGQEWKPASPSEEGYVSLFDAYPPGGAHGCGYAVTYVKCPAPRKAVLHGGTVGGLKAWLNGKQVLAGHFGRYPFVGHQDAPIELQSGWNELLIKSTQLHAFWGFTCDLLTPEGKLMTDLTYKPN